jgi:hypothetical protein
MASNTASKSLVGVGTGSFYSTVVPETNGSVKAGLRRLRETYARCHSRERGTLAPSEDSSK